MSQTRSAAKPRVILCVDDEVLVLESLMGQLWPRYGERCILEVAQSAADAWEVIDDYVEEGHDIAAVISDWLMPITKGDAFLVQLAKRFPKARLIMLSGHADEESIERARRYANLYTFIAKPWEKSQLFDALNDILEPQAASASA